MAALPPPQRPAYRLTVAGRDITPLIEARLIDLVLTDEPGPQTDQLDLTLDDSDGKLDIPPRGAHIRVWLGWAGEGLTDKGDYVVDEVEHSGAPDRLILRARSADLRATLTTRREHSWHATTVGDILATLAGRNAVTPAVSPALAAQPVPHLDQTDESDANLITRLARDYDAVGIVKHGRLVFTPAGQGVTVSGKPLPAVAFVRQDGDQHRFTVSDRDTYTGVRAWWHDTRTGQRWGLVVGDDATPSAPATTEPSAGTIKALRHVYASEANAKRAATSEWQRLQRGVAQFSLTLAHGRAELLPEQPATVSGFKRQIDQAEWRIARLTHRLGDSGFTTVVELDVLAKQLPD